MQAMSGAHGGRGGGLPPRRCYLDGPGDLLPPPGMRHGEVPANFIPEVWLRHGIHTRCWVVLHWNRASRLINMMRACSFLAGRLRQRAGGARDLWVAASRDMSPAGTGTWSGTLGTRSQVHTVFHTRHTVVHAALTALL